MSITIKFSEYIDTCPVCGDMTHIRAITGRKIHGYPDGVYQIGNNPITPNRLICDRCYSMWNRKTGKIIRRNQHILLPIINYK